MIKLLGTTVRSSNIPEVRDGRVYSEAKLEALICADGPVDMTVICGRADDALAKAFSAKGRRVERIIANGPATIVFWDDGEKTVVKCRECVHCSRNRGGCGFVSPYDSEKAVMAAMLKRLAPGWQDDVRKAEREVQ